MLTTSLLLLGSLAAVQADVDDRAEIADRAALPATTYTLSSSADAVIEDDDLLRPLAELAARDLEQWFARYRFTDATLERELLQGAFHAAMLLGDWEGARGHLQRSRALEERADLQRIGGMHWEAWIDVQGEAGRVVPAEERRDEYRARLAELLDAQPWPLVEHEISRRAARSGMLGRGLLDLAVRSTLGNAADAGGEVDAEALHRFLALAHGVRVLVPLKDEMGGVYSEFVERNATAAVDSWSEREVALSDGERAQPVRVGVWDTGVDVSAFPDQLWSNAGEWVDGRDNDGNGFVDDVHGIAYDTRLRPTRELLYPRHPDDSVWRRVKRWDSALSDMLAHIDSPEARELAKVLGSADEGEARTFLGQLMHYAVHSHGTHVAGIALADNPFARLVVARIGIDHRDSSGQFTPAWAHRYAAMCHETVEYFVRHGVRVVNISWGWGIAEIVENLRNNGFDGDDAALHERARAIHAILERGISDSLRSAPEILFVCGAGNSGADSSDDRFVPSSLTLPNLVTVGGVDQSCRMVAFTSFGDHVTLYANGYQVMSEVPGGERRPQSGTSMSSPQVANLAAKLLALDPTLTPAALLERIRSDSDPRRFAKRDVLVVHPRRAVERLRAEMTATSSE